MLIMSHQRAYVLNALHTTSVWRGYRKVFTVFVHRMRLYCVQLDKQLQRLQPPWWKTRWLARNADRRGSKAEHPVHNMALTPLGV
jgi:hypothetical protein